MVPPKTPPQKKVEVVQRGVPVGHGRGHDRGVVVVAGDASAVRLRRVAGWVPQRHVEAVPARANVAGSAGGSEEEEKVEEGVVYCHSDESQFIYLLEKKFS